MLLFLALEHALWLDVDMKEEYWRAHAHVPILICKEGGRGRERETEQSIFTSPFASATLLLPRPSF